MTASHDGGDSFHSGQHHQQRQQQFSNQQRTPTSTYVSYQTIPATDDPGVLSTASVPYEYGDSAAASRSPFLYDAGALNYPSAGGRDYSGSLHAQWPDASVPAAAQDPVRWHHQQGYDPQAVTPTYMTYDPSLVPTSASWTSSPPTTTTTTTTTTTAAAGPLYPPPELMTDLASPSYFTPPAAPFSSISTSSSGTSTSWYSSPPGVRPSASPGQETLGTPTLTDYDYFDDYADDLPPPSALAPSHRVRAPTGPSYVASSSSTARPGPSTEKQARPSHSPKRSASRNHTPQGGDAAFIIMHNGVEKRGYHPPDVWESHKEIIRRLYLDERRPLKDVVQIMDDSYGFRATPKMYKTKFTAWGFAKNNTEKEAKQILYHKLMRDAQGKRSVFSRHGKQIDLQRYLRRKGVSEMDLVDFEADGTLPPHVRCWTPP